MNLDKLDKRDLIKLYSTLYTKKKLKNTESNEIYLNVRNHFINNEMRVDEIPKEYSRFFDLFNFDYFKKTINEKYIVGFNSPFSIDNSENNFKEKDILKVELTETINEKLTAINSHLFFFQNGNFVYNKVFRDINFENFFLFEDGKIFLIDSNGFEIEKGFFTLNLLDSKGNIIFKKSIINFNDFFKVNNFILLNYIDLDNKRKISLFDINLCELILEYSMMKKHFSELRNEIDKSILDLNQFEVEKAFDQLLSDEINHYDFQSKKIHEIKSFNYSNFKRIKFSNDFLFVYDSKKTFHIIYLKSFEVFRSIKIADPIIQYYIVNQTLIVHSYNLYNKKREWKLMFINILSGELFSSISLFENGINKNYFLFEKKIYIMDNENLDEARDVINFLVFEVDERKNNINQIKDKLINLQEFRLSFEINNRTFLSCSNRKINDDIFNSKGIKGEYYERNKEIMFNMGDNDFINEYILERCPFHNNCFFPHIYDIYNKKKFKLLKLDKELNLLFKVDFSKLIRIERDDTIDSYFSGNFFIVRYNKNKSEEYYIFIFNEDFQLLFYKKYYQYKPLEVKINKGLLFIVNNYLEIYDLYKPIKK